MTKIRSRIAFFAVMLCMTVFIFPLSAFAASDSEPPTVTAKMTGNVLRIEARDNDTGVEAVFVDDNRINYRVDSALEVDPREYHAGNETISVYAVDFAGNKSEVVTVKNPYHSAYVEPEPTPEPSESALPPFTPDGTGTVVDNITDPSGKEFFTIQTPDGNVFYLIIDRSRDENGVYLLNAVTEDDLASLAKEGDGKGNTSGAIPTPEPTPQPEPTPEPQPEPTPEPEKESGGIGTILLVLLIAAGVGGAGWYFKVYKPKQDAAFMSDDDMEDDEDEGEGEIQFADEQPETEDGDSDDEEPDDYADEE